MADTLASFKCSKCFCGAAPPKPVALHTRDFKVWQVQCGRCGRSGPDGDAGNNMNDAMKSAVRKWNAAREAEAL
jgi:phosphatidylethanolamine-binding protein (PEBP) family uncharacterized protein